jgi:hypothetical protein
MMMFSRHKLHLALSVSTLVLPQTQLSIAQSVAQTLNATSACIARIEYIADDSGAELGSYERISPDGRFILRSFSGSRLGEVILVEIVNTAQGKRLVHHATPLKNEAFPVQGSWRYLVNPNGDHYLLDDMLKHGTQAKPKFRGGMTGFYAAAAELEPDAQGKARIRSLSWPNANASSNGNKNSMQGIGALSVRTITVDTATHRITADTGAQFICSERRLQDGTQYGLPMLSVDGHEFSAVPQSPRQGEQTMRVYGLGSDINAPRCELKADLQFASGKATFGFAQSGGSGGADLVFEYRGDVWWYNRVLNDSFNLADYARITRVGAFPGITQDGRVIVAATWLEGVDTQCKDAMPNASAPRECKLRNGYAIIDPYQSVAYRKHDNKRITSESKSCVKR